MVNVSNTTYAEDGKTTALFLFNHVIARFGVLQSIVTNHGSHFHNQIMEELSSKLVFLHENSMPYYPQANGQVEAINKVLKTMVRQMVGDHIFNCHLVVFSALWAYRTSMKTTTGFMPFQLVYGLEAVLLIQCQIPSLQLAIELLPDTSTEEARFLYLNNLDETRRDVALANDAHKKCIKEHYDKSIQPHVFNKGDLVLTYD